MLAQIVPLAEGRAVHRVALRYKLLLGTRVNLPLASQADQLHHAWRPLSASIQHYPLPSMMGWELGCKAQGNSSFLFKLLECQRLVD